MVRKFLLLVMLLGLFSKYTWSQQTPPNPPLYVGEKWTKLYSMTYDYQTNGSVRYIAQDPSAPSNLLCIIMAQQDSNTAAGVGRYVYFSYSTDNGNTWSGGTDAIDNSAANGFPCLSLRVTGSGSVPIVAMHISSAVGSRVYQDATFGGFGWAQVSSIPPMTGAAQPIWPHVAGTTNGNIVLAAAPNATPFPGQVTTYNGSSWAPWTAYPNMGGPSGNFEVASGTGGMVGVFGFDYNGGSGTNAVTYLKSTNNGTSWDAGTTIFTNQIDGADTLYNFIEGGRQATFVGVEPHFVFGVYSNSAYSDTAVGSRGIVYPKPKILHWSPSTGITTVASHSNILTLTDSVNGVNVAPLCQPTITKTANGTLVCAFTAYLKGNKQQTINGQMASAGEILTSISTNGGLTWSIPLNRTNSPAIEEKHPSLMPITNVDSLKIYYVRDMMAGSWVNDPSWGARPVYGIYKTAPLTGIREDVQNATDFKLFQNYPNPFNPTTTISYSLRTSGFVTLKVYDMLGKEVATLVNGIQTSGPKEVVFDGQNLSSGMYFYTINAGDFRDTKRMMLVK